METPIATSGHVQAASIHAVPELEGHPTGAVRRLGKVLVSAAFYTAEWCIRQTKSLLGIDSPGTCIVLYYHAVRDIGREAFAEHMAFLLRHADPVRSDFGGSLARNKHSVVVTFHDAFVSVLDNALPLTTKLGIPVTIFVPTQYVGQRPGWIEDKEYPDYKEVVMSAEQLRALDPELICLGSHGVAHSDFSRMTDEEARRELRKSKADLEQIIGRRVTLFAFPYGGYSEKMATWAKEAGYERIFTTEHKLAFGKSGEFVTGSCMITPEDWPLEFRLKMLGAYRWMPVVHRVKTRIVRFLRREQRGAKHSVAAATD